MTENSHETAQHPEHTADRAHRADGAADVSTNTPNETGDAAIPELVIIS
ncbi:RNase adaptor protein RapZ, partial [Streptomyces sp. SID7982]|nr:RNase adaptor protein RapZ [Streptomyces sp. SID7982]